MGELHAAILAGDGALASDGPFCSANVETRTVSMRP